MSNGSVLSAPLVSYFSQDSAAAYCRVIIDPTGPYAVCVSTVNTSSYYNSCMHSYCTSGQACDFIRMFESTCARATGGFFVSIIDQCGQCYGTTLANIIEYRFPVQDSFIGTTNSLNSVGSEEQLVTGNFVATGDLPERILLQFPMLDFNGRIPLNAILNMRILYVEQPPFLADNVVVSPVFHVYMLLQPWDQKFASYTYRMKSVPWSNNSG